VSASVPASLSPTSRVSHSWGAKPTVYFGQFQGSVVPPDQLSKWVGKESTGGQTFAVLALAEAAAKAGYNAVILSRSWNNRRKERSFDVDGGQVKIVYLPDGVEGHVRKEDMYPQLPALAKAAADYIAENHDITKPDPIVWGHYPVDGWMTGALTGYYLQAKGITARIMGTTHSLGVNKAKMGDNPSWRIPVRLVVENVAAAFKGSIFTVSPTETDDLKSYGVESKFIPNGVNRGVFYRMDDDKISESLASGVLPEWQDEYKGRQVIDGVSRFVPTKGIKEAIIAMAEVIKTQPNALLVYAGAPSAKDCDQKTNDESVLYYRECQQLVEKLGLQDHVKLWPSVSHQGAALLHNVARQTGGFCIAPSLHEPFGLVPLEAGGCGTPLVLSNRSGFSQCLDDQKPQAMLIDPKDPQALALAMTDMLVNQELREDYGERIEAEVNTNYTWSAAFTAAIKHLEESEGKEPLMGWRTLARFAHVLERGFDVIEDVVAKLGENPHHLPFEGFEPALNFAMDALSIPAAAIQSVR
jgi:D-inositol-3-phosphate glycosyltransferase